MGFRPTSSNKSVRIQTRDSISDMKDSDIKTESQKETEREREAML